MYKKNKNKVDPPRGYTRQTKRHII